MRRVVVSRMAMPPLSTKPATLTLLMCYVVLVMGMFMLNLLVLLMSTFNGLFGFLRPLLLTSKDSLQNGYQNQALISCRCLLLVGDHGCSIVEQQII